MGTGQKLYQRAKQIIPGGVQLLSKRPEMFLPDLWPAYYSRASGCEIWDLDGNKFEDTSYMGIGACVLGYSHPVVNDAVIDAVRRGSMTTLNAPEEVYLAELMCELHPWAEMVRYTRSGGEAMMVAIRIARASSGKDKVLFCGYHGWHDWYLAANLSSDEALNGHLLPGLSPRGVPRQLKDTSFPFVYNDTQGFLNLVEQHKENLGVVVMEVVRNAEPDEEFLSTIRRVTSELGAVLIIDEITAGFRLNPGGAHLKYNMIPDIAVFGKALTNGFPMGVIIGKRFVMDAAQETFISSTYWTERIGPTAALNAIRFFTEHNVHEHLISMGTKVQNDWESIATAEDLDIQVGGRKPLSHFSFNHPDSLVLKTIFTQEMLKLGYLATTAFYVSLAHSSEVESRYMENVAKVFRIIADGIKNGTYKHLLKTSVCQTGFKRLL